MIRREEMPECHECEDCPEDTVEVCPALAEHRCVLVSATSGVDLSHPVWSKNGKQSTPCRTGKKGGSRANRRGRRSGRGSGATMTLGYLKRGW